MQEGGPLHSVVFVGPDRRPAGRGPSTFHCFVRCYSSSAGRAPLHASVLFLFYSSSTGRGPSTLRCCVGFYGSSAGRDPSTFRCCVRVYSSSAGKVPSTFRCFVGFYNSYAGRGLLHSSVSMDWIVVLQEGTPLRSDVLFGLKSSAARRDPSTFRCLVGFYNSSATRRAFNTCGRNVIGSLLTHLEHPARFQHV